MVFIEIFSNPGMEEHMYENSDPRKSGQVLTTRRGFFKLAIGIMSFVNGLVLGIPFLSALVSPSLRRKMEWSRLGEMDSLPVGRPVEVKFRAVTEDAYHFTDVLYSVWVIKHSADEVTVLSPICTHLGCHFLWNSESARFGCPCHASVFDIDGKVLYGPAPRPLDILPSRIDNGVLFARYERFKVGIAEKIEV
jgi:quinol---cytochrome c reductase iron-sulfur subunit, bacillus type